MRHITAKLWCETEKKEKHEKVAWRIEHLFSNLLWLSLNEKKDLSYRFINYFVTECNHRTIVYYKDHCCNLLGTLECISIMTRMLLTNYINCHFVPWISTFLQSKCRLRSIIMKLVILSLSELNRKSKKYFCCTMFYILL